MLLKVTPQISDNQKVRLDISQETTSLDQDTTIAATRPTTLKRSLETTVTVKNKHTLILGGLIGKSITNSENKIPLLHRIPGIGLLFKAFSRSMDRTNLYVFLTPYILDKYAESDIYRHKKENIEKMKGGSIKLY